MFKIQALDIKKSFKVECELIIGDHKEIFPLITTFWTLEQYELQWRSSLLDLTNKVVKTCILITDIQPEKKSSGISYWALFREGPIVFLQERFCRNNYHKLIGPSKLVEPYIPPRIQGTEEDQSRVSEWEVSLDEIII